MMPLSKSLVFSLVLCSASASLRSSSRRLSFEKIGAGYEPRSQVTDHNAIDQDQKAMEAQLALATTESYNKAKQIYQEGAFSKSFAEVTLEEGLPGPIQKDDKFVGKSESGDEVRGRALENAEAGATKIKVQYHTTDVQASYVNCQVGALEELGNTEGCFASNGSLTVDGFGDPIAYKYVVTQDNNNGRTLAGFSTGAQEKMYDCPNCPYVDYKKFYDYYNAYDYGNQWVLAAFSGGKTSFKNGNADFGSYEYDGRTEAIKKGTAYMNVWMYVIREMEDALDDCKDGCIDCNDDPVHAWDEAVAFYTGSLQGQDGPTSGYLTYTLANKRCQNFKTCGNNGNSIDGTAKINLEIFRLFNIGQQNLLNGQCAEAKNQKLRIAQLMAVPLVQGTLRYAYLTDSSQTNVDEKAMAEGAVFAASVLPIVHACNADDAKTIYDNMAVASPAADFAAVKGAFERNYGCMGVSCSDVGGLYDSGNNGYYAGASPCGNAGSSSSSSTNNRAVAIGVSVGVIAALLITLGLVCFCRKRKSSEIDPKFSSGAANGNHA